MNDKQQKVIDAIDSVELPALWQFALQLTHDKQDAELLVQRTCERALEQSARYNDKETLKSWLFTIAYGIWKNELRSKAISLRNNRPAVNAQALEASTLDWHTASPETRLEFQKIVNAMEALPEDQRIVVQLIYVNGFSYTETASILNIASGVVMNRLATARVTIGERFLNNKPVKPPKKLPQSAPAIAKSRVGSL